MTGDEDVRGDGAGISRRRLLATGVAAAAVALTGHGCAKPRLPVSEWSKRKKHADVDGIRMAYYEVGHGDPIVFLHGNPTSSYLWRKVIPHVQHLGRCIAPDLVGMGDSHKLPNSGRGVYTYVTHQKYLYGLLEQLGVDSDVTLVIHDWGSALGFRWAHINQDKVKGIAFMESMLIPPDLDDSDRKPKGFFKLIRSDGGEKAILEDNAFVENFLFADVGSHLTEEDRAEYLRPFQDAGESRRPTLTWPREIPLHGKPETNDEMIRGYSGWLAESEVPKLFIRAMPGLIGNVKTTLELVRTFPNLTTQEVPGGHYVQEVSGDAIGRALAAWVPTL